MKTQPDATFAYNLRRLRLERRLAIVDLADAAGLTRPFLSSLEHGKRGPSWSTVCVLADAMGVSTDEFRAEPAVLVV